MSIKILGTGSSVPKRIVTNDDLAQIMDTSDEWIRSRTGIRARHLAIEETSNGMAAEAGERALLQAGMKAEELDMILVATLSPDQVMPNTACEVQKRIGAKKAVCIDLNAACSGFLFALHTAAAYIASGFSNNILVIGVETLSKVMDWNDRSTCVLFGDGAGAAVVTRGEENSYEAVVGSNGEKGHVLELADRKNNNPYVSNEDEPYYVTMDGQEVFKFAVSTVPNAIKEVVEKANVKVEEVDHFLLHQANERILQSVAKRLKLPLIKFPMNLERYGNTSSASIVLLLDELNRKNEIKRGDKLVLCGFGGGLTWGAIYLTW